MFNLILALGLLPLHLAPAAPFPKIITQAPEHQMLAPGVEYEHISFFTAAGPLEVRIVAVDLRLPSLKVQTVLAANALISPGETVRSIAQRSTAVAAINGDYFDLGHTNQPLGLTITNGILERVPRKRYALVLRKDGSAIFQEERFQAHIEIGSSTFPIDGLNAYPLSGLGIITPAFGRVPANPDVTIIPLQNASGAEFGKFIAGSPADNSIELPAGTYLVVGASAYSAATIPATGTIVNVIGGLSPVPLHEISAAIGGGPLLLSNGLPVQDADGPNFFGAIPSSGVGITKDQILLLVEVDGRQSFESVGLTRPAFAALFASLGATDAMALDGGGSSTMALHLPTDPNVTVRNRPSDGKARRVGDALVIVSHAPIGPPNQILAQPQAIHALVGAVVPLRFVLADANQHRLTVAHVTSARISPTSLGEYSDRTFIAKAAGRGTLVVWDGRFLMHVPVDVEATPSRVVISPPWIDLAARGTADFQAQAFDARGYRLTLPTNLDWSASNGRMLPTGQFTAAQKDAEIALHIGQSRWIARVRIGSHTTRLQDALAHASFRTYPVGGAGGITKSTNGITLDADFEGEERGAYVVLHVPLPPDAQRIRIRVDGDGCGAVLRIALRDANGMRIAVGKEPIAWAGQQDVVFPIPPNLVSPLTLSSMYLVAHFNGIDSTGTCHIGLNDLRIDSAGTGANPAQKQ